MIPECPLCGGAMTYEGIDDGGGDWGSAICDQYHCPECDYDHEANCIEDDYEAFEDEDTE